MFGNRILPAAALVCAGLSAIVSGCSRQAIVVREEAAPQDSMALAAESLAEVGTAEPEEFRFPDDTGGKLLAEVLLPSEKHSPPMEVAHQPGRHSPPAAWMEPELPILPSQQKLPRLTLANPLRVARPGQVVEELPLPHLSDGWLLLEGRSSPVGPRIRVSSPDVSQPPALPFLARQAPERVAVDDPTAEASAAAALALSPPPRLTSAPYLRLVLPDPFEHRRTVQLSCRPTEESSLPVVSLQPPKQP
jgi:hypothetical protein